MPSEFHSKKPHPCLRITRYHLWCTHKYFLGSQDRNVHVILAGIFNKLNQTISDDYTTLISRTSIQRKPSELEQTYRQSKTCVYSIHSAIYDYVSPFLTEWQHGFIKGRSCEPQLILTHHQWAIALDKGRQVDVVFLDFSKAFDKANHAVLLQKLCNFGITD